MSCMTEEPVSAASDARNEPAGREVFAQQVMPRTTKLVGDQATLSHFERY